MAKGKKSRGKKNRNQTGPSTAVGPESTPTVPESAILGQQGSNGGDSVLGGTMSMLSDDDIAKLTQVSPPQSSGLMGATVHSAGAMGPPPLPPSTRASAINAVGHIESPSHSIPGLLGTADPPASAQSGLVRQLNNLSLEEKKRVLKAFRQLDGRELPEAVQNARSVTTSETTSGQTSATSGKTSSTTEVRECEVMASLDEIQEHLARLSLEEKEEEPEAAPVPRKSSIAVPQPRTSRIPATFSACASSRGQWCLAVMMRLVAVACTRSRPCKPIVYCVSFLPSPSSHVI